MKPSPRRPDMGVNETRLTAEWRMECAGLRIQVFNDGASIYRQDDELERVFVIIEGQVRLSRANRLRGDITIAFLGPDEPFGSGLTRRRHALESAICRGSTEVYEVATDEFQRLIALRRDLGADLTRRLAMREQRTADRLMRVASLPVRDRIIATLLDLMTHHGTVCQHGHEIDVRVTSRELADLSASGEDQVLWVLNDLEWRRIISYTQDRVCAARLYALDRVALDANRRPSPGFS